MVVRSVMPRANHSQKALHSRAQRREKWYVPPAGRDFSLVMNYFVEDGIIPNFENWSFQENTENEPVYLVLPTAATNVKVA